MKALKNIFFKSTEEEEVKTNNVTLSSLHSKITKKEETSKNPLKFASSFFNYVKNKGEDAIDLVKNKTDAVRDTAESYTYIVILIAIGSLFILMSLLYLPMIILMPKKFCGFFTLGSLCLFASLFMSKGFGQMVKLLFARDKALYSTCYALSLLGSFYYGILTNGNFVIVLVSCVGQIVSVSYLLCSLLPGGTSTLTFVFNRVWEICKMCWGVVFGNKNKGTFLPVQ